MGDENSSTIPNLLDGRQTRIALQCRNRRLLWAHRSIKK